MQFGPRMVTTSGGGATRLTGSVGGSRGFVSKYTRKVIEPANARTNCSHDHSLLHRTEVDGDGETVGAEGGDEESIMMHPLAYWTASSYQPYFL